LRRKKASLVDYLVGAQQCRSRHFDGQRLGRLEIEDELEFRCALNREFGRLSAFELTFRRSPSEYRRNFLGTLEPFWAL
jgi:hypothetical protein